MAAGRRAWDALFDVGRGELGTVLAETHSAAALAGEGGCRSFFVHAGLSVQFLRSMAVKGTEAPTGELIVEALNSRLSTALAAAAATGKVGGGGEVAWDRRDRGFFGEHGPFWYRGYALDRSESRVCIQLAAVLAAVNATRMVVGHTVQEGGARSRCGGAMVLLDAGLSDAYYSRPTAFECVGGQASILERMPKGGVRRRLLPTPRAAWEAAAV